MAGTPFQSGRPQTMASLNLDVIKQQQKWNRRRVAGWAFLGSFGTGFPSRRSWRRPADHQDRVKNHLCRDDRHPTAVNRTLMRNPAVLGRKLDDGTSAVGKVTAFCFVARKIPAFFLGTSHFDLECAGFRLYGPDRIAVIVTRGVSGPVKV